MKFLELSIKETEKKCKEWALEIKKEYNPDIIVYVAKAGYLIAEPMKDTLDAKLVGIDATREGNSLKEIISPILSILPNFIKKFLRKLELKSNIHNKKNNRNITFHESLSEINSNKKYNILVVDDSVDTGNSMKQIVDVLSKTFSNSKIKTAALNVWSQSEKIIFIDYALYRDTVIKTPCSKDSKEYKKFIEIYKKNTKEGKI